mmetsp:Transcript_82456/g.209619  ORF Transcript_82456/g.209619 Transcript_82456/m.209619 type:complete len:396 (+) Transcript_82456:256-1443(+)
MASPPKGFRARTAQPPTASIHNARPLRFRALGGAYAGSGARRGCRCRHPLGEALAEPHGQIGRAPKGVHGPMGLGLRLEPPSRRIHELAGDAFSSPDLLRAPPRRQHQRHRTRLLPTAARIADTEVAAAALSIGLTNLAGELVRLRCDEGLQHCAVDRNVAQLPEGRHHRARGLNQVLQGLLIGGARTEVHALHKLLHAVGVRHPTQRTLQVVLAGAGGLRRPARRLLRIPHLSLARPALQRGHHLLRLVLALVFGHLHALGLLPEAERLKELDQLLAVQLLRRRSVRRQRKLRLRVRPLHLHFLHVRRCVVRGAELRGGRRMLEQGLSLAGGGAEALRALRQRQIRAAILVAACRDVRCVGVGGWLPIHRGLRCLPLLLHLGEVREQPLSQDLQ